MFDFTDTALDPIELVNGLRNPGAGAMVSFEGWVRNTNDGQDVSHLEYEAFESLARKEGDRILEEARARFDVLSAVCIHRLGELSISDMAVWVGVCSPHRKESFQACQYIIDEVKRRVPIWKKEYYADGTATWVACHHCGLAHSD